MREPCRLTLVVARVDAAKSVANCPLFEVVLQHGSHRPLISVENLVAAQFARVLVPHLLNDGIGPADCRSLGDLGTGFDAVLVVVVVVAAVLVANCAALDAVLVEAGVVAGPVKIVSA